MKKEQRRVYVELADLVDYNLCSFCKYSECLGGESPCDTGEPYCVHPLEYRLDGQWGCYGMAPGDDCWGFRPAHSVDFFADVVGIILQKGWQGTVWWQNKKGDWRIAPVQI